MKIQVQDVKDAVGKVLEKAVSTTSPKNEPDLAIMEQFDSNVWKACYLLAYYSYHTCKRIISLWFLFSIIQGL